MLVWARERAGFTQDRLAEKVKIETEQVAEWEKTGKISFTLAKKLSKQTYTPFGYLFLDEPVEDQLTIPDFRHPLQKPSPNLIETIEKMERRQEWMRNELIEQGHESLSFVRSKKHEINTPEEVATNMRQTLDLQEWDHKLKNKGVALRHVKEHIEEKGVMVFINGIVGNNTRRKLNTEEFRGFALLDEYAPIIFINGTDTKAAQLFTLVHELAHIWIGKAGISNFTVPKQPDSIKSIHVIERFCNQVVAEFFVPTKKLRAVWKKAKQQSDLCQFLANHFKVSRTVIARRVLDLSLIASKDYSTFYQTLKKDKNLKKQSTKQVVIALDTQRIKKPKIKRSSRQQGGAFWDIQSSRVGKRFGAAVYRAAKEGRLLYREAYSLIDLSGDSFEKFATKLNIEV